MFKEKPRKSRPPLEGGDHPELDTSELCDEHQTKQFQTLIGQLQWLISLGRFDIAVHVMSLSRFRAQPRKGHLDRAKRIVGYLLFLPDGAIRFRTGEPDFSSLKDQEYDWTRSVYSGACEQIPHDIPKPLGKHVQTTHYVDANLHHDLATGKAVTAVLHFLNQTPIDAYTKRQSTVETATYGSEFVAARTAIGLVLPTTKVTVSPGGSSLRILKRSSFVLVFAVLSELQQTSVLHHLQGRGPHFLFPFLILNNLQLLCHLTPLMHQHPILSNLSKVSLVKMKIIQSTWPTLTSPVFLADPSFYHLRIMGSATWPKSLTLMTMDNLLKTLNSG